MANIIAVIWDCDKTLVDGYMQDPIFEDYNIDSGSFWREVNAKVDELTNKNIRVNKDTYYLNHFIHCTQSGKLKGLSNKKLKEYGKNKNFMMGFQRFLRKQKTCLKMTKATLNMVFR